MSRPTRSDRERSPRSSATAKDRPPRPEILRVVPSAEEPDLWHHYLLSMYDWWRTERKSNSWRTIAQGTGFSTSAMHGCHHGGVRLSEGILEALIPVYGLSQIETQYLRLLHSYSVIHQQIHQLSAEAEADDPSLRARLQDRLAALQADLHRLSVFSKSERLGLDAVEVLGSNWYIPVIHQMAESPGFVSDAEWIASHLRPQVSVEAVAQALTSMERVGLLVSRDGRYHPQRTDVVVPSSRMRQLSRNYQLQMQERAAELYQRLYHPDSPEPPGASQTGSVTFAVAREDVQRFREALTEFNRRIYAMSTERRLPSDQVYQFTMQLFPVSELIPHSSQGC